MQNEPPEITVIGAGPAGLMAAEVLGRAGRRVTVYDRMPSVGRKFLMAGRGGLNLTHSEDLAAFLGRYGPAGERLRPCIEAFGPADLRLWCESLGEATFVGSSGRVFPKSFKASPLLRAWLRRLDGLGVRIATRQRWEGWDDEGRLRFRAENGSVAAESPAATVLALGGASWPRLGSDGAWTGILAARGVPVAPLRPANMGVAIPWSEHLRARFEGEPVKRIALRLGRQVVRGEAVITAEGLEGGAVYALSAAVRDMIEREGSATLHVDLRPDLDAPALARRLGAPRAGQSAATFLRKAASLSPVAIALLREGVAPRLPDAPEALADAIKAVPLRVTGTKGLGRAISTAGGVALDALDESFMLHALPGVFVAGEMLDWEAPTGGYLLQASFSTAVRAAKGVLRFLESPPGLPMSH